MFAKHSPMVWNTLKQIINVLAMQKHAVLCLILFILKILDLFWQMTDEEASSFLKNLQV